MAKKKKKEKIKTTGTEEVLKVGETTGTEFPKGFDPDLPMNKQREFK